MRTCSLELLTRSWSSVEMASADEGAGQGDQGVVQVEVAFEANGEACELVEQGEGLRDHEAQRAQPLHALGAAGGDDRDDAAPGQFAAQSVAVGAGVRKQRAWAAAGPTPAASHRRDPVDQVAGRADVVDVPTGGDHLEWDATAVAAQMVLGARAG